MRKLTRKEHVKSLLSLKYPDAYIKTVVGTTTNFIKECRLELEKSISLMKIDGKR